MAKNRKREKECMNYILGWLDGIIAYATVRYLGFSILLCICIILLLIGLFTVIRWIVFKFLGIKMIRKKKPSAGYSKPKDSPYP